MTHELAQFLAMPRQPPTFAWETTEALPMNWFVVPAVASRLGRCCAVLVPSRAVEQNARSSYGYHGPIRILPFWTEDRATGESKDSVSTRSRFVLFVGRMDPDKGFRYLIPAFQAARRIHSDIELTVCGGGTVAAVPELQSPGVGVAVRGKVSSEELDHLFAGCAAVVLPSLHEGYPMSLLEACSFSKPVIATRVGSIPEVFSNRKCAILVPPRDAAALERAILRLFSDPPEVYAERCADARKLYEEVSSAPMIREALIGAYAVPGVKG